MSKLSDAERKECMSLGQQFKQVRTRAKLSQPDAAKKLGLESWRPAQIEQGNCGIKNIQRIRKCIVQLEDMIRNTNKKTKAQSTVTTGKRLDKMLSLPGVCIKKQEGELSTALTGDECYLIPDRFAMIEALPDGTWKLYPLKASTMDPRVEVLERDNARLKLMLQEANDFKTTARSFFSKLGGPAPLLLNVVDIEVEDKQEVTV